jgi:hypothetical protein
MSAMNIWRHPDQISDQVLYRCCDHVIGQGRKGRSPGSDFALSGRAARWRAIHIRQLLAHSSGLPDIVDEKGLIGEASDMVAWAKLQTLPMEGETGAEFA